MFVWIVVVDVDVGFGEGWNDVVYIVLDVWECFWLGVEIDLWGDFVVICKVEDVLIVDLFVLMWCIGGLVIW